MTDMSSEVIEHPSGLKMVRVPCALCGSDQSSVVLVGVDREHGLEGEFTVRSCEHCGLARLDPRPDDGQVHLLYPASYRPFQTAASVPTDTSRRHRLRNAAGRLLGLGLFAGDRRGGRLLEVGCGTGDLLAQYAEMGWEVKGIEPAAPAVAYARSRGLDVVEGTDELLASLGLDEQFDRIHAFMVVEHTPDPVATLRRFLGATRPGGTLRVSVPNFGHWTRRRFGTYWYALQLPRHYQHFTVETLHRALTSAGWSVERTWYQPTNRDYWGSVAVQLEDGIGSFSARLLPIARVLDLLTLPVRLVAAQLFGSSRMVVTATRPIEVD